MNISNVIYTVIVLLLTVAVLKSQDHFDPKWSLTASGGIVSGGISDTGTSLDIMLDREIVPKLRVGVFANQIRRQVLINDFNEFINNFEEFVLGPNSFNGPITALDIERFSDLFHENTTSSSFNIGLQLTYDIVDTDKFNIRLGGGLNRSSGRSTSVILDSAEPTLPQVRYSFFRGSSIDPHGFASITYALNDYVSLGTSFRLLTNGGNGLSSMFSIRTNF